MPAKIQSVRKSIIRCGNAEFLKRGTSFSMSRPMPFCDSAGGIVCCYFDGGLLSRPFNSVWNRGTAGTVSLSNVFEERAWGIMEVSRESNAAGLCVSGGQQASRFTPNIICDCSASAAKRFCIFIAVS